MQYLAVAAQRLLLSGVRQVLPRYLLVFVIIKGKGLNTYAYFHCLQERHYMFIKLEDARVYQLPEGREVMDDSLLEVKFCLRPQYLEWQIDALDKNMAYSRAIDGSDYLPGFIGLNNVKMTDYVNVVVQVLSF